MCRFLVDHGADVDHLARCVIRGFDLTINETAKYARRNVAIFGGQSPLILYIIGPVSSTTLYPILLSTGDNLHV